MFKYLSLLILLAVSCNEKPGVLHKAVDMLERPAAQWVTHQEPNLLTLYVIPSPFGINWASPRKLMSSALLNYISFLPNFMGHVGVEVDCELQNGSKTRFYSGMTDDGMDPVKKLIGEGSGLGILYEKFPGVLDQKDKVYPKIMQRLNNPGKLQGISFIQFKISRKQCDRIHRYEKEYRENALSRYYSLYSRPLYGEGAGCSAYGVSYLQVINALLPEMEQEWKTTLKIPTRLIGPPVKPGYVSLWSIIWHGGQWAQENEPSEEFYFWGPDQMHKWIISRLKKAKNNELYPFKSVKIYKTTGLFLDLSRHQVPDSPIWSKTDRPFFKELIELNKNLYP
jgi:hypothetical protein